MNLKKWMLPLFFITLLSSCATTSSSLRSSSNTSTTTSSLTSSNETITSSSSASSGSAITTSETPSVNSSSSATTSQSENSNTSNSATSVLDETSKLSSFTKGTGWPQSAITNYLTSQSMTYSLPSLTVTGDSYAKVFSGIGIPKPYLYLFLPTTDYTNSMYNVFGYHGWDIYPNRKGDGFYGAIKTQTTIEIDFLFISAGDGFPLGFHIMIWANAVNN